MFRITQVTYSERTLRLLRFHLFRKKVPKSSLKKNKQPTIWIKSIYRCWNIVNYIDTFHYVINTFYCVPFIFFITTDKYNIKIEQLKFYSTELPIRHTVSIVKTIRSMVNFTDRRILIWVYLWSGGQTSPLLYRRCLLTTGGAIDGQPMNI